MRSQYRFALLTLCILVVVLSIMNVFSGVIGVSWINTLVTVLMLIAFVCLNAWRAFSYASMRGVTLTFGVLFCYMVFSSFLGKTYSSMLRALIICFAALMIGVCLYHFFSIRAYVVIRVFCIGILISSIYYLLIYAGLGTYEYELKNNYTPMVLFSIVLAFLLGKEIFKNHIVEAIYIIFEVYIIFISNCRSVILTTCVLMLAYFIYIIFRLFFRNVSRSTFVLIIIIGFLIIFFRNEIWDFIYNSLRLNVLELRGIEKYSSDRLPMIQDGIELWSTNLFTLFFGASSGSYVECFYINTLTFRGIFGLLFFIVFFATILSSIVMDIKEINRMENEALYKEELFSHISIKKCGIVLLLCGFLIAIFEAEAPFIQGSTYFILWMVIGMSLTDCSCLEVEE